MALFWGILAGLALLVLLFVSVPVKIHLMAFPVRVKVQWHFYKLTLDYVDRKLEASFWLLWKPFALKSKAKKKPKSKPKPQKAEEPKQEKKKKPSKKRPSLEEIMALFEQKGTKKILRIGLRFLLRLKKSIRLKRVHGDIGVQDVFTQGIITGWLGSLPVTKNFRVQGNFQEFNQIHCIIKISVIKILLALVLLIATFPYLFTYRTYKRLA